MLRKRTEVDSTLIVAVNRVDWDCAPGREACGSRHRGESFETYPRLRSHTTQNEVERGREGCESKAKICTFRNAPSQLGEIGKGAGSWQAAHSFERGSRARLAAAARPVLGPLTATRLSQQRAGSTIGTK